jgi:hypothetical protein
MVPSSPLTVIGTRAAVGEQAEEHPGLRIRVTQCFIPGSADRLPDCSNHVLSAPPGPHSRLPPSIQRAKTSIRSRGQAPSHGIDPSRSRARIASACALTAA